MKAEFHYSHTHSSATTITFDTTSYPQISIRTGCIPESLLGSPVTAHNERVAKLAMSNSEHRVSRCDQDDLVKFSKWTKEVHRQITNFKKCPCRMKWTKKIDKNVWPDPAGNMLCHIKKVGYINISANEMYFFYDESEYTLRFFSDHKNNRYNNIYGEKLYTLWAAEQKIVEVLARCTMRLAFKNNPFHPSDGWKVEEWNTRSKEICEKIGIL